MVANDSWREDLETWLAPFLADLTHPAQRRMCPAYIAGLIGPGDRKSIQPLAARTGDVGYDQLHHFIASGTWDAAPFESRLLSEADRLVGDGKGYLVIDDTALPKKGRASVSVAPQYASSQGKTANCQSLVSVTLASREVPVMVGLRLFLPESWTDDPARMKRAWVPADTGYGSGAAFRQALSERNLLWAEQPKVPTMRSIGGKAVEGVGLSSRQTVYAADVELTFPTARGGRPRKYHILDQGPVSVADMLAGETWRKVAWRRGIKGRLTCLFAAKGVRIAEGHPCHRPAGENGRD